MIDEQVRGKTEAAAPGRAPLPGGRGALTGRGGAGLADAVDRPASTGIRSFWLRPSGVVALLALAYGAAVALLYFIHPADDVMSFVSDFAEVPIEVVGLLLCIAVVMTEHRPLARAAWLLFALAIAADGSGNLIYGLLDSAGQPVTPSLADACYLAFYPLLLTGLLVMPTASRRRELLDWRVASNIAIVIVGGSMAVLHFVLAPVIPDLRSGDPLASAILLAYPVGDLALTAALATVTTRRPLAGDQQSVVMIGALIILWLFADLLYAIQVAGGDGSLTWASDLLYIAGALCMVLAAHANLAQRHRFDRNVPAATPEAFRLGPYLMLLLGSTTLIAAAVAAYVEIAALAAMAVVLTGLVVARQIADERERRRADLLLVEAHRSAAAEARWKARHDPLTGLANRARLEEILHVELLATTGPASRPVTLAFVDLNDFKSVNDTLGHAAGDELLVAVANRLARAVRSSDTVVRLGGDEFAIVLPRVAGDQALDIVTRAAATLDEPFAIAGTTVSAAGAFGISSSSGVGRADFDPLLSRADTAMYRAKRLKLGPTFFDPAVDELVATPASPAAATSVVLDASASAASS